MLEILQTIWIALTTPNEGLTAIIFNKFGIPFIFIELTMNMLLFTTVLDIKYSKKQYILYMLLSFLTSCVPNILLDKPYSSYINMIVCPFIIMLIFKVSLLKGLIAEFLFSIISLPIELIFIRLCLVVLRTPYETIYNIPLLRIVSTLFIYLCTFITYLIIKKYKHSIVFIELMSKHNKIVIFLNSVIGVITIATQFYLIGYYNDTLPSGIILLSFLTLIAYFTISIFSLLKTTRLEITSQNLEQEKYYNTTLKLLFDDIRTFRHDFGNIVQAIGGYANNNDVDGLKQYYKQLQLDFEDVKSLEMLNPTIIDNPAIYSLLTAKYHKATDLGISMKVHVSLKLEKLNMKIYEFSRVLGILLDNAIEACENCDEKIINLEIRRDEKSPRQLLLIQNTYYDKNVNLERINEKGYTSKKNDGNPHGLGLWEVNRILKRAKNLNLYTTKDSIFFTQQLEIYDK